MFAQIAANHPRFKEWLEARERENRRYLTRGDDHKSLFRAQGRAAFIEELIELLATAHNHLR
jgi:hypothetical protein